MYMNLCPSLGRQKKRSKAWVFFTLERGREQLVGKGVCFLDTHEIELLNSSLSPSPRISLVTFCFFSGFVFLCVEAFGVVFQAVRR